MNNTNKLNYIKLEAKESSNINIVFVHGTGCNKEFLKVLAEMFKEFNCYLIDLPGHGDSKDTGYNVENYTNSVRAFISDLDNVILVGHSLGGVIVVGVGELNLDNVKGLVILNSAAKFSKVEPELEKSIKSGKLDMDKFLAMLGNVDNPEVREAVMKGENIDIFLKDSRISITADYEENLKDIQVPVCIITGEKDQFGYPELSEYLHKELKKSELYIMKDAMHSLPIVKKKEVYEIVKRFINKCSID